MKKVLFVTLLTIFCSATYAQEDSNDLQKVLRINFMNPGIEFEMPITRSSIISINPGIGYNESFVDSRSPIGDEGMTYFISPFIELSYKNIYNYNKRASKGKKLAYNSGNYFGLNFITKFKELNKNEHDRMDNTDFSIAPTWGIKRSFSKFNLMVEYAPSYYFDTQGYSHFFPLMLHLNMGFNMRNW